MALPHFEEKLRMTKVEPPTDYEISCMEKLALGDYEIGFERTNNLLDEAMEIFIRSSRSSMGVAGDSMVALFTAAGDLVNASCGTFLHAIIQSFIIKFILRDYKDNPGVFEGDVFFSNDALYGGIHTPDEIVLVPIFHGGELIAWSGAGMHSPETGAIEPGGMPTMATSRFMEGMGLPPMKIGSNYTINNDFLEMAELFGMRAPEMVTIDIKARATGADRVRIRMQEYADEKGRDWVVGLLRKMLVVAEEGARKRIASWPDGKYRCVNFADGIAKDVGLIRSSYLTMTKQGDRLLLDFTGTSPDTPYSYNAHVQAVVGHISNYIYEYIFYDLPVSNATFNSIDFIMPEGTCLNPHVRAGTSCAVMMCTGVMSGLHNVFSKMIFPMADLWDHASAPQGNAGNAMVCAGISQWNVPYVDQLAYPINTEGQGGRPTMDGVDVFGFPWCVFGRAPDVEDMENELPLLIAVSNRWRDCCGHGKQRGGVGTVQIWICHGSDSLNFMAISDNSKIQTPQPLFGGYQPCTVPGVSVRNADIIEQFRDGAPDLTLDGPDILAAKEAAIKGDWEFEFFGRVIRPYNRGDIVTFGFATGGSGYGDVLDRNSEAVMEDLRNDIISHWTAENIYLVRYDHTTLRVDVAATEEARHQERQRRIARGKSHDEFMREWSSLTVDESLLKFYGSYPDAKCVTPVYRP